MKQLRDLIELFYEHQAVQLNEEIIAEYRSSQLMPDISRGLFNRTRKDRNAEILFDQFTLWLNYKTLINLE